MRWKKLLLLLLIIGIIFYLTTCAKKVTPKPNTTFIGDIEISEKASTGTISFKILGDGSLITSISITLTDVKANGFSAGSITQRNDTSFSITEGNIDASISAIGDIKGRFTSPTKANGTIHLLLEVLNVTYDLGTWNWSASTD